MKARMLLAAIALAAVVCAVVVLANPVPARFLEFVGNLSSDKGFGR